MDVLSSVEKSTSFGPIQNTLVTFTRTGLTSVSLGFILIRVQYRQWRYDVTKRRVRASIVAVEKQ